MHTGQHAEYETLYAQCKHNFLAELKAAFRSWKSQKSLLRRPKAVKKKH